ncbi:MAG: hypothetical protein M3Z21_05230 [Pseudomonadota bacterium]|nr:hypothetical protein [Pseudomonadota bacterium]
MAMPPAAGGPAAKGMPQRMAVSSYCFCYYYFYSFLNLLRTILKNLSTTGLFIGEHAPSGEWWRSTPEDFCA